MTNFLNLKLHQLLKIDTNPKLYKQNVNEIMTKLNHTYTDLY